MTVMLRLDPAHPPLWRDTDTLQFGVPEVARLTSLMPWQEKLLDELGRGISESGVDVWAECARVRIAEARAFVAALGPALRRTRLEERGPTPPVAIIRVTGPSPLLDRAIALGLAASGWEVRPDRPDSEADAQGAADLVVLIADHALDAGRSRGLMLDDRAHLPVVSTGAGVVVGPLVLPGDSACATCVDLHRRDADADWPALAGQLATATPPPLSPSDALEAAAEVVRAAAAVAAARRTGSAPDARRAGAALTVCGGERTETFWEQHPDCGCRIPAIVPVEGRRDAPAVRVLAATA